MGWPRRVGVESDVEDGVKNANAFIGLTIGWPCRVGVGICNSIGLTIGWPCRVGAEIDNSIGLTVGLALLGRS